MADNTEWSLVNPLPRALAHFEAALRSEVGSPLAESQALRPDFELGEAAGLRKLGRSLRAVLGLLRAVVQPRDSLVVWPAFGLAELALWRLGGRSGRRLVIVHDPEPLRAQVGYGRIGNRIGRWGSRGRHVEVVAHTQLAASALAARGIRVGHVLPHPAFPPVRRTPGEGDADGSVRILVLGQYKDARDVKLLEDLPAAAPTGWSLRIAGRGWPELPGWRVTSRFLSEEELVEELAAASVVLLPYDHYFQSGIATRAFEQGVPVVGRSHEFLESIFGPAWEGTFEGSEPTQVIDAIRRVVGSDAPRLGGNRAMARDRWRAALRPTSPAAAGAEASRR